MEPPLGFQSSPVLSFQSDFLFPRANTCSNTLYIALQSMGDDVHVFYVLRNSRECWIWYDLIHSCCKNG